MPPTILFNKYDIFGVLRGQEQQARKRIQEIPGNQLLNASEQDLIAALIEEFQLDVPVLKEDQIYIADAGESQVDVSGEPKRIMHQWSGPYYVAGSRTVIAVPFEGEAVFFEVQPHSGLNNSNL
jgi:hypothetical protein